MAGQVYTVQEISRLCMINISTVMEWIDGGRLKAFRTPAGHRRVHSHDLVSFLTINIIPIPASLRRYEKKILEVDDDPTIIYGVTRIIKRINKQLSVETAADGREAGLKFRSFNPDLVILDILLPHVDGFSICREIKASGTDVKILAITGQDSDETKNKILSCGADDYMGKPFDPSVLTNKIAELLNI